MRRELQVVRCKYAKTYVRRSIVWFLSGIFILLATYNLQLSSAHAADTSGQTVKRVEDYLSNLTTVIADFTQVAPDGSLTGGKFFLKRPGKMRWQYDPPTPILMIANGSIMTFYDYELEQVNNIPIEETLLGVLTQKHIDLADSDIVQIEWVENKAGVIRIEMSQKDREDRGRLRLEFADNPLQIRNMRVTDAQGQTTNVSLQNAKFGTELKDELFVFKDPRKPRRRT